jgi:hypothetical protein
VALGDSATSPRYIETIASRAGTGSLPFCRRPGMLLGRPIRRGCFFVAGEKPNGFRRQIWFQPYPEGQPFKISNDLNEYQSLSVAADGKSFVSTQSHPSSTIYVGDAPSVLNDKIDWKLAPVSTEQVREGWAWTTSGKLVERDAGGHIFLTAPDGSNGARVVQTDDFFWNVASCGGDLIVADKLSDENTPMASQYGNWRD